MEQKYIDIAKKKGIENFKSISYEFNIEEFKEENVCKKIAEKICEKLDKYKDMLENFIQTDGSSVAILTEIKVLDDSVKDKINLCYKEIIVMEREFYIANITNSEEFFMTFIKNSLEKWENIKPLLIEIISKVKEAWKKDFNTQEYMGYLG